MAELVDAVIVGGGIAGASIAYFLARLGVRDILVLDRAAVAAGASGRASGLVSFLVTGHPLSAALLKASADFYADWEEQVGGAPAINRVGGVLLASASERDGVARDLRVMREAGHQGRMVERDELAALVPGWDLTDVDCAAYSPFSGYIDPPMVTTALMNRARALGVRVYQGAEVIHLTTRNGRATGVTKRRGEVVAPVVVIAAGAWTASLLAEVGEAPEIWPERHQVMHFRPPAEMPWPFPVAADVHNSVYFRPEHGGLVLAANIGPDQRDVNPEDFENGADPWYGRWIQEHLARRIPAMREATVAGGHAGVYLSSADDFPLLGPVGDVEGLYCLCDTAGSGMTSSPGLGRALAETIVRGKTFVDISPLRPSRFAERQPFTEPYKHSSGLG